MGERHGGAGVAGRDEIFGLGRQIARACDLRLVELVQPGIGAGDARGLCPAASESARSSEARGSVSAM